MPESEKLPKQKLEVKYATYFAGKEKRLKVVGDKIIIQKKKDGWLKVFIPSDKKGWMEVIKNINGRKWNVEKVYWELPNVKQSYRQLKKHIGMVNIQFDFKIGRVPPNYQKGKEAVGETLGQRAQIPRIAEAATKEGKN